MPTGLSLGPYVRPPSANDEAILAPIREGRPENIPGLDESKPDFNGATHKIVCLFAIERKKRPDSEYIRCAICSVEKPKFLDGAVLWSSDQWLRLIGHVCAAKPEHFGEANYRALRQERQQEELDEVAFRWLEANIPAIQVLRREFDNLRAQALFLEGQQKLFWDGVGSLASLLETIATRHNGVLSVEERLSGAKIVAAATSKQKGAGIRSQFQTINIGSLIGTPFLSRPARRRSRHFETMKEALGRIPEGDGEAPLLELIAQGQHEMTIIGGQALRTLQRALRIADECADAARFVGDENIELLEKWGSDRRNTSRFSIRRSGGRVTFVLEDLSRATVLTSWPQSPDLSLLRRVVETGTELEKLFPRRG